MPLPANRAAPPRRSRSSSPRIIALGSAALAAEGLRVMMAAVVSVFSSELSEQIRAEQLRLELAESSRRGSSAALSRAAWLR
jgi:hypothetical protein